MAINYLTVKEVAKRLSIHPETVKLKIKDGKIQSINLFGMPTMKRIPETEIERLIKEGGLK